MKAPYQYEYQYIRWSLLEASGKRVWTRTCRVNNVDIGYNYELCSKWESIGIGNLRGVGNEAYSGYSAFVFSRNSKNVLIQGMIDRSGRIGWSRECFVKPKVGIAPLNCGDWWEIDLTNLRGVGNESYTDVAGYVFFDAKTGEQILRQTVLSTDLYSSWERICPIDIKKGILWSDCADWSERTDLSQLIPDQGDQQAFEGVADHYYFIPSKDEELGHFYVRQALIEAGGSASWGRTCPLNEDGTLDIKACRIPYNDVSGSWGRVDLTAPGALPSDVGPVSGLDEIIYTLQTDDIEHP